MSIVRLNTIPTANSVPSAVPMTKPRKVALNVTHV